MNPLKSISLQHFLVGFLLLGGGVFFPSISQSQINGWRNWRTKKIATTNAHFTFDSLSIVPGSFQILGINASDYLLDENAASLTWLRKPLLDSVSLRYRVLPISLLKQYSHKDPKRIDSQYAFLFTPTIDDKNKATSFVEFNKLDYNGSYGRSISVGNNQDAALTSNFNLQVNGYLPDSIRIEAAISDNTLPFQPEGNTQNLQQFDQVYIRLSKKQNLLQLGDYNIERPKGYFLNVNKRVQGLYFQSGFRLSPKLDNTFAVSGSVAKGEFSRNIFDGKEGNQGPYKLTGNNGEQFFIVLAGTEKVFINGLIQERGENADYIINYNTGEIRFMPRRLITKDSRIQVEFEYQSRNYLNSLIYAWDELKVGKKLRFHLNVYSNQDAKNQGYNQTLNGAQKRFLAGIGDNIGNAYYPVVALDTFAAGKTLYKIIDTTVLGVHYDSVFVYSTNPDSAQFNISFSYLGAGKGNYVISSRVANGRAYDWVAPIGGQAQGDYAPLQLLVTPKQQQVFTLNTNYQFDSFKNLNLELASSNYNPNLFASGNTAQHFGFAGKLLYAEQRFLGKKDSSGHATWTWKNEASYEYVDAHFRAIAPYRNVEFARDWNVPIDQAASLSVESKPEETLASYNTALVHKQLGAINYGLSYYSRGRAYEGYRNVLAYSKTKKSWRFNISGNLLQAKDTMQSSWFFRPNILAEYQLPFLSKMTVGARFQQEDNRIRETKSDTLRTNAYRFSIASIYLRQPENKKFNYSLGYSQRIDELPRQNAFLKQSHSQTIEGKFSLLSTSNQRVSFTGSYRNLHVDDTLFNNQKNEETGLGRIEYSGSLFKGALMLQSLYETGAGQEQKQSFTYVEVPAGQGIYYWIDYNNDGVQQPNEFQIGLYPDQKKFIRILTPTNDYVRANYVTFNQSISINPEQYFGPKANGLKGFISRFSDQGSLQITNRLTNTKGLESINPFVTTLRDARIISAGTSLSNTLFFNRNSPHYGIEYTFQKNANKQLLTYGVEGLSASLHTGKLRWNINQNFSANLSTSTGLRGYASALSDGRTYAVHSQNVSPALTWIYRGTIRITGSIQYEQRYNEQEYGGEKAIIQRGDLEFKYSKPISGVLSLKAGYAGITFNGLTSAPVAFTLLDALQPGANFLWYANWDRRIGKGIELSIEYEGRKPETGTTVHTGRMTVRAIL